MAFPSDAQRAKQRREEERQRARAEERRQAELDRRQEEDAQQQREEDRRQEALQQAQEFEAALEAGQQRRATTLARVKEQKRIERRGTAREEERRDLLLEILRDANRQARSSEQQEAARREDNRHRLTEERQAEQRQGQQRQAAQSERQVEQHQAARQEQQQAERREENRMAQREEDRQSQGAAEREAERAEARREAARQEQRAEQLAEERQAERASQRAAERAEADRANQRAEDRRNEAGAQRQEEARAERQSQNQAETQQQARAVERAAERQAELSEDRRNEARQQASEEERLEAARQSQREARQQEQQEGARQDQQEAERREAARQARLAEQQQAARAAQQAEDRRAQATQARADEQRQAADRAARRQVDARNDSQRTRPTTPHAPLEARITSGALSGSLPWLRTDGKRIRTLAGDAVTLRGVNLLGLDSAPPDAERGFAAGAGITEALLDAVFAWDVNVVRVAVNHQRAMTGVGDLSAWDYLAELDHIIERAAAGGAYTMLSLRRLDDVTLFGTLPGAGGQRAANFIAPQPSYDAIGMWRVLGERYADEPAVLFDLYAAPHAALADDLTGYDTDWELWTLWVRLMIAELRRLHPRALCFVCGLDWGADLSGFPVLGTENLPIPNLVYAARLFPQRESALTALRALAQTQPVFVTEWGGAQTDVGWGARTAVALRASGIGWTAAHWNAEPPLVQMTGNRFAPTAFGAVVRRDLAMAGERLTAALLDTSPGLP